MTAALVSGERGAFAEVAHESFTLPSRYYLDPDIHAQEIRKIFRVQIVALAAEDLRDNAIDPQHLIIAQFTNTP